MTDLTWHARAACRNHPNPNLWFPTTGQHHHTRQAQQICAHCPVQTQCAQSAIDNHEIHGIWGGQPQTQRRNQNTPPPANPHHHVA